MANLAYTSLEVNGEDPFPTTMTRPRLHHGIAWLQVMFRVVSLLSCYGCMVTSVYISVNFTSGTTHPVSYLALLWVIIIDNAEIFALMSTPNGGIKRLRICPLVVFEALGLVFFLVSFFVTFVERLDNNDMSLGGADRDHGAKYRIAQWFMVFIITIFHIFLIFIAWMDSCMHDDRPRTQERAMRIGSGQAWRHYGFRLNLTSWLED
ncbi:hypothetical protein EJ04DRAFT_581266 [Polyplosphaeria fusca]|uniref:Uncharacterized protein n=1 Tax=Polyplosphaeria fusca TaxID=682080 RepID=A0A9P4UXU5_9PLEO|nr:hypothetical protein EJ04DRAFT_581266 [Polyplosphaeria fusca]